MNWKTAVLLLPMTLLATPPAPSGPMVPLAPHPVPQAGPRASAPAEDLDPPRLEVEPKGRQSLGMAGPREKRTQVYAMRNTSPRPIRLRVLDLSPGLTLEGPALMGPILPGQTANLILQLDPAGWTGIQTRNARVGTDDPRQGIYYFPVQVNVRPDLTVDALRKDLGEVAPFESPAATFQFKRETGDPLRLKVTSPLSPYLDQELVQKGGEATLAFVLRPQRIPPGVQMGLETVEVETNAPLEPRFTLYVEWKLHHPIQPTPSRLVILDPRQHEAVLQLKARDGKPFTLLSATVEGTGFKVGPLPLSAATQSLTVVRTGDKSVRSMLVLAFKDQDAVLKVPLAYLPSVPPPGADGKPRPAGGAKAD